jgi:hypothetical protein
MRPRPQGAGAGAGALYAQGAMRWQSQASESG